MKLKVMVCCYGGNAWMAEELRPVIENELDMQLITIHEWENADIKWNKDTWLNHLRQADIVICPSNYKLQPAKSANRLTQAMSIGKPVVCSPLPSYLEIAEKYPGSFLIADTKEEWKEKLRILQDTPLYRQQLSLRAIEAAKEYSIDAIGSKWIEVLKDKECVDIVIPTYKNLRGLKLCLESVRMCTDKPYKIIIVNNGDSEEMHNYLQEQKDIHYIKIDKCVFSKAINTGIKAGDSNYIMILNDDVIVSKNWLNHLMGECKNGVGAIGPLSNCDKGWLHNYDINIGNVDLLPGSNTFEQIEPIVSQIYDYKSPYNSVVNRDWIAFYCTLIPRKVIEEVGILDESFTNSGEDVDLCNRIRKKGYSIIQTFKSFVFHFGAISRKCLEDENKGSYQEADKKTQEYLNIKYSKPLVVIYSGPSWERWSYKSVDEGGIGGSETWQVWLARELSKLNYRVISFADCPEPEMWDGDVKYLHYTKYPEFIDQNYIDYFISSRTTDTLKFPIRAGKIFVKIHDIFLLSNKEQTFIEKVDKFCVLSKWHMDFVHNYHNIPYDKMAMVSNGIDFNRYDNKNIVKHPYKMFWSSSLDRGLDTLLYLFDFIKAEIPELELHIYYGMQTWEASVRQRNDIEGIKKIEEIKAGMNKPGVFYHDRVGQKELAEAQLSSSLWAFSSDFEESFCITAVEAQRAGCPIVASNYAGLQTTVGDSGILIGNGNKGESFTKEYRERFVQECISILKDREKWNYWFKKGLENSEKYSWKNAALRWKKLFEENL